MGCLGRFAGPHIVLTAVDTPVLAVAQSVCALLNSGGGRVFVGARGPTCPNSDIPDVMRRIQAKTEGCLAPRAVWSVSAQEVDGHSIVVVDVPAGSEKPYLCEQTIFVRRGAQTQPADQAEISELVKARQLLEQRWERKVAPGSSLSDLDSQRILDMARAAIKRGRTFDPLSDPWAVLNQLGLADHGHVTNAAVVLFGRYPERQFPQTRLRIVVYDSDKAGESIRNDKQFEGNLLQLFESAVEFLKTSIPIREEFDPEMWVRRDEPQYPLWSLREGLANALVHRDFSNYSGGVHVGIYPNRIQIWNMGQLPDALSPRELRGEHPSVPPNPDIAQVFFLLGIIERIGRGTQRIAEECKAFGLPPPRWESAPSGTKLVIHGRPSARALRENLNERQVTFVKTSRTGQSYNARDYARIVGGKVTDRTVRTDLARLVAVGLVQRRGVGRQCRYVRTHKTAEIQVHFPFLPGKA